MIFPFPKLNFSFFKIPVTWILIIFNSLVFFVCSFESNEFKNEVHKILEDKFFYTTQARVYKNYVLAHPDQYGFFTKQVLLYGWESSLKSRVISMFALGDQKFTQNILGQSIAGDTVAISYWRDNFKKISRLQKSNSSYSLGVIGQPSWVNFLSYQFTHASYAHIFSNMLFLLFFGALIEPLFGSLMVLLIYLGSGVVAAQVFLIFSQDVNAPLVGASGSISGLMAFYCLAAFKKNMRFYYFLFIPKPEYFGRVHLPVGVLFFYWLMSDLAGFLSQVSEHTGVAYVAHLGGQVAGACVAVILLLGWKVFKKQYLSVNDEVSFQPQPLAVFTRSKTSSHGIFGDTSRFHKLP